MRNILYSLFIFFCLFSISYAKSPASEHIVLTLPQSVIAQAAATVLPLAVDAHSKSVQGDINIISISDVVLSEKFLSCRVRLAGRNLALLTEVAGHEIKLKVGSVDIDSKVDAALRFDAKKQLLYIKPVIREAGATAGGGPDISQAIVALLNGREFPVEIQKLNPLMARAGAKIITINMQVADIATRSKSLQLSLLPKITASGAQKSPQ